MADTTKEWLYFGWISGRMPIPEVVEPMYNVLKYTYTYVQMQTLTNTANAIVSTC